MTADDKESVLIDGKLMPLPDFVIPRTPPVESGYFAMAVVRQLKKLGVRTYNDAACIERVADKLQTHQVLIAAGLPTPTTMLAKFPIDIDLVEEKLGFPVVVKTLLGVNGTGVFLMENRKAFQDLMELIQETNPNIQLIFQKFVAMSKGRDLRLFVLNGRVIGAMERRAAEARRVGDYPFQMSGGQRQRVMIAMALACKPKILIADEPTTALDVTVQAQIFDLLRDLRRDTGTSIILITHDMGAVAEMADRVIVMYAGRKAEIGPVDTIISHPRHPYTKGLISCVPHIHTPLTDAREALTEVPGIVPSLQEFGADACLFASRCAHRTAGMPHCTARGQTVRSPSRSRLLARGGHMSLLSVKDLSVHFAVRRRGLFGPRKFLRAVESVSFDVAAGETLAIVGESGSGKTTTALAVAQLVNAVGGSVRLEGDEILGLQGEALRQLRSKVQFIFQDPYSSLNPRRRAEELVREPLDSLTGKDAAEKQQIVDELFAAVGLRKEQQRLFPHQFSGGQRQRIGIARALATRPKLVICDEPVSALDVAVQAQILNLLRRLQDQFNLTYLFVSHDLGVVQHMSDHIAVMYMGRIVEFADRMSLFNAPRHPYTAALLSAVPMVDASARANQKRILIPGDPPDPIDLPAGCRFANRCPLAEKICGEVDPELADTGEGHKAACHHWQKTETLRA